MLHLLLARRLLVAHVAAHKLGAAAYAIDSMPPRRPRDRRVRAPASWSAVGSREQLPVAVRELVLEDQRLRNEICWSVFDC